MLPIPALLLVAPVALAALLLPWRRWPRLTAVAGIMALAFLSIMLAGVPLASAGAAVAAPSFFSGDTWLVFGWPLAVTEAIRATFLLVYVVVSLIFALTLVLAADSGLVPGALLLLAPLAAALMVRPFAVGVLALLAAAAFLTWLIQSGRTGSTRAALRSFLMTAVAVPLFLLAGWMVETDSLGFMLPIARLTALGMVVLLAGFPFHLWVSPALAEAPPLVVVLVFGLVQFIIVIFCLNLLSENAWLPENAAFAQIVRLSGALTVITAGLLAYNARTLGNLLGYLLLLDIGVTLLLLAFTGPATAETLLSLLLLRMASLVLATVGLSLIRDQFVADGFTAVQGAVYRSPLGVALFTYGSFSLIGLPLTPGFSGRWSVLALIGADPVASNWLALVILLAAVGAAAGLLRCLVSLLAPPPKSEAAGAPEPIWRQAPAAILLVAALLIALFPQIILTYATHLATLFALP
jgi:NADH:ubiquinone oxidoreductase subunit 2 (subunit N)